MLRAAIAALVLAAPAAAADWPQFLGPTRDGVSAETVAAWTDPPKVLWRAPLGEAHSSPVVAQGVVYAFYKPKGEDADALAAFDAKSGRELWTKSYDRKPFTPPFGAGPRGTPAVHSGKVYTLGSTGILACWDAKSGEIVWKVDTLKDFAAKNLFFGVSTSPIVVGDNVIVMVGGMTAGIVGFDKSTGKVAWKTTSDPASYAGPTVTGGAAPHLVFLTASNLRAVSPAGESLWAFPFKDKLNESSTTPVVLGDLVIASSVTAGSVAVKPQASGNPTLRLVLRLVLGVFQDAFRVRLCSLDDLLGPGAAEVWKNPKLTCYFSTPVPVGDDIYMINGQASLLNASITLRCVDGKTGKVRWEKPKIGKYHAAIVRLADDKLLMLDDVGRLTLIQPDSEGYKELAQSKVCRETWAHPALADGVLYVRDDKELIALQLAK